MIDLVVVANDILCCHNDSPLSCGCINIVNADPDGSFKCNKKCDPMVLGTASMLEYIVVAVVIGSKRTFQAKFLTSLETSQSAAEIID